MQPIYDPNILVSSDIFFHQLGPQGRVGLVVTKSVCLSVCLFIVPFQCDFLRGRTSAERASSVDWCDLDLE